MFVTALIERRVSLWLFRPWSDGGSGGDDSLVPNHPGNSICVDTSIGRGPGRIEGVSTPSASRRLERLTAVLQVESVDWRRAPSEEGATVLYTILRRYIVLFT